MISNKPGWFPGTAQVLPRPFLDGIVQPLGIESAVVAWGCTATHINASK